MKLICLILILHLACYCWAQPTKFDSIIGANSYSVKIEKGKLRGSGTDFLLRNTKDCQFVCLGEEHNNLVIPDFTTALFALLQEAHGFHYLALEEDPLRSRSFALPGIRGQQAIAVSLARQYPYSYTFATDQEIKMMTDVSKLSTGKGRPLWGCDQAFGVLHYLKELLPLAPTKEAKAFVSAYIDTVSIYENNRDKQGHFLVEKCKASDIAILKQLYQGSNNAYANWLIHCLEVSERIYENWLDGGRSIVGGYYKNGFEREEYMKTRIMEEYNHAVDKDKNLPKAILKFGHWHVMNGLGPSRLETAGSFVRALAKTNGRQSFYISTGVFDHPDSLAARSNSVLSLFAKHVRANEWTLFDLRPFRLYHGIFRWSKSIPNPDLLQQFEDYIFKNDALLLFGTTRQGSYEWKK